MTRPDDIRRGALGALLAAFPLLALACGGKPAAGPAAPPPVAVEVRPVAEAEIHESSEYLATVKSRRSVDVQPQAEGVVTRIFVKSGDRVAAGQPLLQIDPAKQRATVRSQEAARAQKRAALDYARQQAKRMAALYQGGAVSKQTADEAESALAQAQADYDALGAQVEEQAVALSYYRVTAPAAGVVGDIPVRAGDRVTTATLLTTLQANEALELYVSVPVERAADLKLGLPVEIVGEGGKALATTRIDFVAPQVNDQTQSVLAKAPVPSDQGLRAAQVVRARIVWSARRGLVVPVLAVTRVSGQYFVFVAEPGPSAAGASGAAGGLVARQRPVRLGEVQGNDYVVLSGLRPGEQVVVSGAQKLGDGAPITQTAAAPAA